MFIALATLNLRDIFDIIFMHGIINSKYISFLNEGSIMKIITFTPILAIAFFASISNGLFCMNKEEETATMFPMVEMAPPSHTTFIPVVSKEKRIFDLCDYFKPEKQQSSDPWKNKIAPNIVKEMPCAFFPLTIMTQNKAFDSITNSAIKAQFIPNSTKTFAISKNNITTILNTESGEKLFTIDNAKSVQLNSDGTKILIISKNNIATVLDVKSSRKVTLQQNMENIIYSKWSPDDTKIVIDYSFSPGDTMGHPIIHIITMIFDVESGKNIFSKSNYGYNPLSFNKKFAEFSPNSAKIIMTISDIVEIWDLGSNEKLFTLKEEDLRDMKWNPDGTEILTISENNIATILNAESGKELFTIDNVKSAQWDSDGTKIIAISADDNTVKIFDMKPLNKWTKGNLIKEQIIFILLLYGYYGDRGEIIPEKQQISFTDIAKNNPKVTVAKLAKIFNSFYPTIQEGLKKKYHLITK